MGVTNNNDNEHNLLGTINCKYVQMDLNDAQF